MAGQRQYEPATVFTCRNVDMRHLWSPSNEYLGKPTTKPNYFGMFITPKTQGHWSQEPVFAGVMGAFHKLLQGALQPYAQNVNSIQWPVVDGDLPSTTGKTSEFAKGHWMFSASSSNPPNVELAQAGGQLVKLQGRGGVKPGDYCMTGVTAAVKQTQANGVKFYLNAVVFTHPGEEIVFANSVSGAELMQQAQRQGLQVAGFSGAPGGFGAAPGGFPGGGQPFGAPQGAPQQQPFGAPQGAPQGAQGFTPPGAGFVHGTGFGNPAMPAAPGPNGQGFGGNATFPSNQAPGPFNGQPFGAPGAFPGR